MKTPVKKAAAPETATAKPPEKVEEKAPATADSINAEFDAKVRAAQNTIAELEASRAKALGELP